LVEAPQEGKVAVDVHADALGASPLGCRPPVLAPPRRPLHAEVAAVWIHLGKDHDIQRLHDTSHLSRGENLLAQPDAVPIAKGAQQTHAEVPQDARSAPFAPGHPREKEDRRTLAAAASSDTEGVAPTLLPGQMRESYALEDLGMVLLAQRHGGFHLIDGEVAA